MPIFTVSPKGCSDGGIGSETWQSINRLPCSEHLNSTCLPHSRTGQTSLRALGNKIELGVPCRFVLQSLFYIFK